MTSWQENQLFKIINAEYYILSILKAKRNVAPAAAAA